jgi:hypothetical protein
MSFLAVETDHPDDDKQWLTYWVCFGIFNVIDQFAGFILKWVPFYYLAKLVLLLFLLHPKTRGAEMVYKYVILPSYLNADIEGELKKVEKAAKGLADNVQDKYNDIDNSEQDEEPVDRLGEDRVELERIFDTCEKDDDEQVGLKEFLDELVGNYETLVAGEIFSDPRLIGIIIEGSYNYVTEEWLHEGL